MSILEKETKIAKKGVILDKSISLVIFNNIIKQLKRQNQLLEKIRKSMILNGQVDLTKELDNELSKSKNLELLNEIEESIGNPFKVADLKIDERAKIYLIKDIRKELDLKMDSRISVLYNNKILLLTRQSAEKKEIG